ncbi:DUF922 domain-containing protein [Pontivivens ytuae]|uniref:DUF922 domain-containing protein n=1 Tax=Pontivivens ytuae TaxID=2789856 RepID=A0A7S9QD64_9RHOB|nr:DUF922 domain-containing protein [Pontivivens ytuae]QPH54668.1 DUF922 domain-containing protein [Pontivivens ytuae]
MFKAPVALTILLHAAPLYGQSLDDIEKDIEYSYYLISGSTVSEIREQLNSKGPDGAWGKTYWTVHWFTDNSDCSVRVQAHIILPQLFSSSGLSDGDRATVEAVLRALEVHENHHLQMGIFAAEEIQRYGCSDAAEIIDYWIEKNNEFDRNTLNGRSEGVELR